MRSVTVAGLLAATLLLGACQPSNPQADALDNAAKQADPAAAAVMRNEADEIRANGSETSLNAADSAAQQAMGAAGQAAANSSATPPAADGDRSSTNPMLTPAQRRANAAAGH